MNRKIIFLIKYRYLTENILFDFLIIFKLVDTGWSPQKKDLILLIVYLVSYLFQELFGRKDSVLKLLPITKIEIIQGNLLFWLSKIGFWVLVVVFGKIMKVYDLVTMALLFVVLYAILKYQIKRRYVKGETNDLYNKIFKIEE